MYIFNFNTLKLKATIFRSYNCMKTRPFASFFERCSKWNMAQNSCLLTHEWLPYKPDILWKPVFFYDRRRKIKYVLLASQFSLALSSRHLTSMREFAVITHLSCFYNCHILHTNKLIKLDKSYFNFVIIQSSTKRSPCWFLCYTHIDVYCTLTWNTILAFTISEAIANQSY